MTMEHDNEDQQDLVQIQGDAKVEEEGSEESVQRNDDEQNQTLINAREDNVDREVSQNAKSSSEDAAQLEEENTDVDTAQAPLLNGEEMDNASQEKQDEWAHSSQVDSGTSEGEDQEREGENLVLSRSQPIHNDSQEKNEEGASVSAEPRAQNELQHFHYALMEQGEGLQVPEDMRSSNDDEEHGIDEQMAYHLAAENKINGLQNHLLDDYMKEVSLNMSVSNQPQKKERFEETKEEMTTPRLYQNETIAQRKSISQFQNPIGNLSTVQQVLNGKLGDERRKARLTLPRNESVDLPSLMIKKLFKISHRPAKQASQAFSASFFREYDLDTDLAYHCLSLENVFVSSRLSLQLRIVVMWRVALLCLSEDIYIRSFWIEIGHHAFCIIIESVQNQLHGHERMMAEARAIAQLEKEKLEMQSAMTSVDGNAISGNAQTPTPAEQDPSLAPPKSMLLESLLHSLRLCEDTISQMEIDNLGRNYYNPIGLICSIIPT